MKLRQPFKDSVEDIGTAQDCIYQSMYAFMVIHRF